MIISIVSAFLEFILDFLASVLFILYCVLPPLSFGIGIEGSIGYQRKLNLPFNMPVFVLNGLIIFNAWMLANDEFRQHLKLMFFDGMYE